MAEIINTSYTRNRGLIWKGIKVTSIFAAITACVPSLVIVHIFRENPILGCFIAVGIVVSTFKCLEHFRGGKYENERLENLMTIFKSPFTTKNLNKEEISRSIINNKEWFLPSGDQLIGYNLLDSNEVSFTTFINSLIPILPEYASLKFLKPQRPDKNVPEHLKSKNISIAEYYVFVRIPMQIFGNSLKRNSLKERILSLKNSKIEMMTCLEISQVAEYIFFPFQTPTGKSKPFFRTNIGISQGIANRLWPDKEIASISLAQLPEKYVSTDFSFIYNAISNLIGCICVTVEIMKASKVKEAYANDFNKRHNGIDDNPINVQSVSDSLTARMQVGILLHANSLEIADAIFSLDIACNSMGNDFKPIFGQDLGFLKKALIQFLPGSRPLLPFQG